MWVMGVELMSPGEEGTESSLQHAEGHFKGLILKCHKWKYAHLNATHLKPPKKFCTRVSAVEWTTMRLAGICQWGRVGSEVK